MLVEPLILDCENEKNVAGFMNFFKEINPKAFATVEKEIQSDKAFLLMNKYNDFWFWPKDLMETIYQFKMEFFNYFTGPDTLNTEVKLILN